MKKKTVLFALVIFVLVLLFSSWFNSSKIIGRISGAEWEHLIIEDRKYERVENKTFSGEDKERFLGIVSDGETKFRIYSIQGNDDYLYCSWEWEGWIYRLVQ